VANRVRHELSINSMDTTANAIASPSITSTSPPQSLTNGRYKKNGN
jgi:hypothetical protein